MTDPDPTLVLVDTDPRVRVSLARLGVQPGRRYLARVESDGAVILEPAVVMTEAELPLRANPALMEQIEHARAHPDARGPRPTQGEVVIHPPIDPSTRREHLLMSRAAAVKRRDELAAQSAEWIEAIDRELAALEPAGTALSDR